MPRFASPFDMGLPPEGGDVTSEYGPRTGGAGTFHEGIDFGKGAARYGADIAAWGAGTVEANYVHPNFGNFLIVNHGIVGPGDGRILRTDYAHRINLGSLQPGDLVIMGQRVGAVGDSGLSFGAHLHTETHVSEPGQGITWNTSNNGGYRTAINPRDFLALFGEGGGPTPTPGRRGRRRPAWQNRPPTLYYRTW